MLSVLYDRTYRHLFCAQIVALLGTGLATVALGLLAYDLAGPDAGAVLGTALAIKMVAYVTVAPVATAAVGLLATRISRRSILVGLDLVRAAVALSLPFINDIWQIYALIFVLQAASAAFTPVFQATIPDVLPDEAAYTRALSLSRLAYDLESILSPMLAAALLTVVSFHALFAGTAAGFALSAVLVISVALPHSAPSGAGGGLYARTTAGIRLYLRTPRLRGLLGLSFATAAAGAMVIVNTVVLAQVTLGLGQRETALLLAAFGGGSMVVALGLPRLLDRWPDRPVMLAGATLMAAALAVGAFNGTALSAPGLALIWAITGAGYSLAQTPSGRLLRRTAEGEDRPALFAAQFALSHACWLITYPLAGWLGARHGISAAFAGLSALALAGTASAALLWRREG